MKRNQDFSLFDPPAHYYIVYTESWTRKAGISPIKARSQACRPIETMLFDLFSSSASRQGQRTALAIGETRVSYAELSALAERIGATVLAEESPPSRVAIMAHRSLEAYAGILATLRAGAAYVPLSPKFPALRNASILDRAGIDTAILNPADLPAFESLLARRGKSLRVIVIDSEDARLLAERFPWHRFDCAASTGSARSVGAFADRCAYVLFTSGTTGAPKGIAINHSNLRSYLDYMLSAEVPGEADRYSQVFDLTFDLSVHDMFVCWGLGGALCVPSDKDLLAPWNYIRAQELTHWFCVPSLGAYMHRLGGLKPGMYPSLRSSRFCGEKLPAWLAEAWRKASPASRVENLYGPTEATIAITSYEWREGSPEACIHGGVPIGLPLPGQLAMVVDSEMRPVPDSCSGELLLAGSQIFHGYLGEGARSEDCFVTIDSESGPRRWYRTGDIARFDPHLGGFTVLGRSDCQVKIMGFRIELSEIEHVVEEHAGLKPAVAVATEATETAGPRLVLFGLSAQSEKKALAERACRDYLPPYMRPHSIVLVDSFPMNDNGKLDRKALLEYAERKHA